MDASVPTALPADIPRLIVSAFVSIATFAALGILAVKLDQWAGARGLRWHALGSSAAYLWPEAGSGEAGGEERPRLAAALVGLIATLLVLAALSAFAVTYLR